MKTLRFMVEPGRMNWADWVKTVATVIGVLLALAGFSFGVWQLVHDERAVVQPAATRMGVWPSERHGLSAAQETDRLEGVLGASFDVYRVRHGDGLDAPGGFAINDRLAVTAAQAGYMLDFRIHAWTNTITGGTRTAIPWSQVTSGRWDDKLRARAQDLKAFVDTYGQAYFTFQHEADLDDGAQPSGCSLENGRDPACGPQFKALYNYVRNIFLQELGTSNARVIWVANLTRLVYSGSKGGPDNWIGGLTYDEVGADGYNHGDCNGSAWLSFSQLFAPAHDYAVAHGKPLNIGETNSYEDLACGSAQTGDPTDAKKAWFRAARDQAVAWGNVSLMNWNHSTDGAPDWWIDTSQPAIDGFKYVIGTSP